MVNGIDRASGFLFMPLQSAETGASTQVSGNVSAVKGDAKSGELGPKECKT